MFEHHVHTWCLQSPESRALDPLELTSYVSHYVNNWTQTLGLLEEQLLLLTAKSSLQYPHWLFLIRVF